MFDANDDLGDLDWLPTHLRAIRDKKREGQTGEAAAWVVRKQKSHKLVSETAMKAPEGRAKAK